MPLNFLIPAFFVGQKTNKGKKYSIAGIMDNNKFVAFAGYRSMTALHSGNIIYIDDLCKLESYRGQGLASQLLKYVKDIAISDNKDAVVLDTDFNNNTAQQLYLKVVFNSQRFTLHVNFVIINIVLTFCRNKFSSMHIKYMGL